MTSSMPALIVFDLDGTLIDSRRDLASSANQLIREEGGVPLDERTIGAMIGDGVRALVERALAAGCGRAAASDRELDRFRAIYRTRMLENTLPYPGVHDTLRRLRRHTPLALLTNKPTEPAEAVLAGLDLARYFRAVVADGSGFPRKPDPASLLHLVAAAEATPADCLYVGDSRVDLETGRAAGTGIALARYGYGYGSVVPSRLEGTEWLLDRPGDLAVRLGLG